MASLRAELAAGSAPACKVCAYIAALPVTEAEEWHAAIRDMSIRNAAILSALRRRGVTLTEASVRRHRGSHVSS